MKTGFDVFMENQKQYADLCHKKIAYLGNCASVSKNLEDSLSLLMQRTSLNFVCAFSPQHGWYGVEQANMIPSGNTRLNGLPVFSLYTNETRKINDDYLSQFDVLVVDLQDVGCRVYTYLTTVLLALKSCAEHNKSVVILDRPNPAGRVIEGSLIQPSFFSVVGASIMPIRYGMTLGEMCKVFVEQEGLKLPLKIVAMRDYNFNQGGWPVDRSWLKPSPNMTDVETARCYSGTVLLEGVSISEGRGTTSPLKVFGFPGMDSEKILKQMDSLQKQWMKGCVLKKCYFKPTFDKYKGEVCSGIRIYADDLCCQAKEFRPFRLVSLFLKAVRKEYPDKNLFLPPPYEYEYDKPPIDILSGDDFLRKWIQDPLAEPQDLEKKLFADETKWLAQTRPFYLY